MAWLSVQQARFWLVCSPLSFPHSPPCPPARPLPEAVPPCLRPRPEIGAHTLLAQPASRRAPIARAQRTRPLSPGRQRPEAPGFRSQAPSAPLLRPLLGGDPEAPAPPRYGYLPA